MQRMLGYIAWLHSIFHLKQPYKLATALVSALHRKQRVIEFWDRFWKVKAVVGDYMWHQRERAGLCSGLLGCFSNREIDSSCCHHWHGGVLKDDAQYRTINAFLAFFQSLYRCLSLFSILLLFFCLIVTKAQAKGGMGKRPEFKRPEMCWCCVRQRWRETKGDMKDLDV